MNAQCDEAGLAGGRVLVVDDSMIVAESLRQALQGCFQVETFASGEACLARLSSVVAWPDLILLDIEMDGIDGFETCQRLRQQFDMPVIFVSSHDNIEERIKAFDSGGDDFVVKPFDPEVVLRKAQLIVQQHAAKKSLAAEKASLQSMAMGFLRNIGDTGVLLNFMRSSLGLSDHAALAQRLLDATAEYGVNCHVQVRHEEGSCTLTPSGLAGPLEESILEKSVGMGRIFQFSKRLVVNYTHVSVLIIDLPEDPIAAGNLRDNVCILVESAEAIAEMILMRKESALRAEALQSAANETINTVEALRDLYRKQQCDARVRLEGIIDSVEKAYLNLGLTDNQETRVSDILRDGADNTLELFNIGVEVEGLFNHILEALQPKRSAAQQSAVWL